jgi:streptogramin lyase
LDSPADIAVVGDGTYYVAEEFSHVIAHLAQDGSLIASFPQSYSQTGPSSIAVDTVGNVIVDDAFRGTLRRLTPADGVALTVHLAVPVGVVLDVDGSYVTNDQQSGKLLRVQPDGSVTVIAGGLDGAEFVARF